MYGIDNLNWTVTQSRSSTRQSMLVLFSTALGSLDGIGRPLAVVVMNISSRSILVVFAAGYFPWEERASLPWEFANLSRDTSSRVAVTSATEETKPTCKTYWTPLCRTQVGSALHDLFLFLSSRQWHLKPTLKSRAYAPRKFYRFSRHSPRIAVRHIFEGFRVVQRQVQSSMFPSKGRVSKCMWTASFV